MPKTTIFHFIKSGLLTTVQDNGRQGYQAFGVPVGGVMDGNSAKIANQLVDNAAENPILEISMFGPKIRVEGEAVIALTGADLSPSINGKKVPLYQSLLLKNGDVLAFGKPINGCRAYLSIAGNWRVKNWFDSTSAATQSAKILTPDSTFQKGSQLKIDGNLVFQKKVYPKELRPEFPDFVRIRVRRGPEYDWFSENVRH